MPYNIAKSFALAVVLALASIAVSAQTQAPGKSIKQNPNVDVTRYEDWQVICPKSNQSQARCKMTQLVKNPKNDQPIMRVVMAYPRQIDGAAMIFVTPLGTRLAPGLKLSAGGQTYRIPFQICLSQGCRADYPIKRNLMNALKQGLVASVQIVGPSGETINLDISLQGFIAANRAIRP